uniref:Uncharacterized protein n=1 Tax=Avena sativa TaxID=4498 RepID=A0ACD5ZP10_AVESA
MESLSLIDVSGDDDFLLDFASPPQHPDPPTPAAQGTSAAGADLEHPAGVSQAAAAGQVPDPSGATVQVPEPTESPKKRKPKGGVNLRKSLAWDSAFFSGEGVLDTEELGIVNSTFRKTQGSRLLPGIVEEMRRSNESTTSTLESESFVLESLGTELFDNVRASIQRTLGKTDKAPGVTAASSKSSKTTAKAPPVTARKGVDRIPLTTSKIRPPISTSNSGVGNKQRPQVTPKEPSVARVAVSRAAEAKPASRPPRALPRVATMGAPANTAATSGISDKRSSTGGVANRQAVGKSANTSSSMLSRPSGGSKTSSTSKSGALSSAAIPSSHSAPMGTMAGAKTKSPTLIGKSRAQRIPLRSSSKSDTSKVDPARASSKIPTRSHGEGASPIISPSSSVDSMSSVISGASTASTVGRASHTSESFSTRSSSLSPSTRKSNDHPQSTKPRPVTVTQGTPCGNLKSNTDTSTQGNGFKPSGLRRPTPKIGYFDAEKSVEQKAARVQLQSTKVLFSPLATPTLRISSTPKAKFEFSTSDQEELKSMAAAVSQTKASPSLPLRAELEASQIKAPASLPLRVAIEVESLKMASHTEPLLSRPLRVAQTELDSSKAMEHETSQTKALTSLLLSVAETEVDSSKGLEHEVHMLETGPLVAVDIAEESIPALHQNIQANTDVSPSTVKLSSCTFDQQESEATVSPGKESSPSETNVAQSEVDPSKVADHEAFKTEESPLRVAQAEVEQTKVKEHGADMLETGPLVAGDIAEESIPALHQNIQANTDVSPSTAAPGEESSPSETNAALSEVEPSKVAEHEASHTKAEMEVEPPEVIGHEACVPQACSVSAAMDNAKENIPALKQDIQPSGAPPSPLKGNILASYENIQATVAMTPVKGNISSSHHLNMQAIGDMTPVTLLTQKLSSISLGASNGEATPLTLLAQKLSSITLGDATD